MVKTKGLDRTVSKWQEKVAGAQGDYRSGIENPKADWGTETAKAEARWKEAIQRAASEGRFGRGVSKAGTDKWKRKALEVGPGRWADGVSKAEDEYRSGMGEVISTIESVTLPPRGPKGDPRNYERVKAIGDALHRKATGK